VRSAVVHRRRNEQRRSSGYRAGVDPDRRSVPSETRGVLRKPCDVPRETRGGERAGAPAEARPGAEDRPVAVLRSTRGLCRPWTPAA